ncbi:MAG: AraC family transcriptional regulator [Lachnospiraceae bacterium]|nr:AraC family transcriptional regulator [Lachnospiraceae bacterium]
MLPSFENKEKDLEVYYQHSEHVPPHLHDSLEILYVTRGTLTVGVGHELFPMEKGDIAFIFPGLVHHYQVFAEHYGQQFVMIAAPELCGAYQELLSRERPDNPVVRAENVHPDVVYLLRAFRRDFKVNGGVEDPTATIIASAGIELILARCLRYLTLHDRNLAGTEDLVYRSVEYVSRHFRENVTLTGMAHDLGVSPYALSRIFSSTFHQNFNKYVNGARLSYARSLLRHTEQSILDVSENAGFESLRTFNRAFREAERMSPREYRKRIAAAAAEGEEGSAQNTENT